MGEGVHASEGSKQGKGPDRREIQAGERPRQWAVQVEERSRQGRGLGRGGLQPAEDPSRAWIQVRERSKQERGPSRRMEGVRTREGSGQGGERFKQ